MLCALVALLGVLSALSGQSASPYKQLTTSRNTLVSDTVAGQNMSIYAVSPLPLHGTIQVVLLQSGGAGNPNVFAVKYTPDPGFTGVDTFTIEINYQGSYPYLIYRGYRVAVFPSILISKPDFSITSTGTPVTANVLANDLSSAGGGLSLTSLPVVNNGTATISGNQSITFTPNAGFTGTGHVNYVVCDTTGNCKTGQFSIGIHDNTPPGNDTLRIFTAKNSATNIPLSYTGYSVFQAPASGSVLMLNGNSFRYFPALNFTGTDQFVLVSTAYGAPAYKTVQVEVLNTPPRNSMAMDDYAYTPKNAAVTLNVRDNDIGNLLVKGWVVPPNFPGTLSNTSGSGNVTFTPNPNFSGVATFYYKIGNMFVPDLELAPVNVLVGNQNPSAGSFDLTTPKSTPLVINYRIPFTGFNFSVLDPPGHGTTAFYPGYTTQTINGQPVSGYNLLIYTPNTNYTGVDEFEINYCVAANGQCQAVKVVVSVVDVYSAPPPHCVNDCVWAGDVNKDGIVNNSDLLPLGYYMGLGGPNRNNAALEWYGQFGSNWNNPYTGSVVDLKHADTDGNGLISSDDTLAIGFFYGLHDNITPHNPPTSKGLPFFLNILTPNPGVGDLVQLEVSLGNASFPVTNLYGFTFNLSLSPQIVDSALHMEYYNDSWLNQNSPDLWMSKTPAPGRLETAFTRTSGVSTNGYGEVGVCDFIIIDIIHDDKLYGVPYFTVYLDNKDCLWGDGKITGGETYTFDIPLRLEPKTSVSSEDFFVYPSPARDLVQFHLNGDDFIEQLSIFDLSGKAVYTSGEVQWEHAELNLNDLAEGMYVAVARTNSGQVVRKFQILR
ncbi:MAG: cadherin-like domain-containing protein [Saprospiraceae bacterium]|nr:cadherin-like domain-containing protein [Saprospiraceae bacterium]